MKVNISTITEFIHHRKSITLPSNITGLSIINFKGALMWTMKYCERIPGYYSVKNYIS